jgi:hypothetical protein
MKSLKTLTALAAVGLLAACSHMPWNNSYSSTRSYSGDKTAVTSQPAQSDAAREQVASTRKQNTPTLGEDEKKDGTPGTTIGANK